MNKEQFERTMGLIGEDIANSLQTKTIAVIGLGGVGGTALEALVRTGFNKFVLVDGDVVNSSNLNRQILYTQANIGQSKVCAAERRILAINPDSSIQVANLKINSETITNLDEYQIDFIIDAIDDVPAKVLLAKYANDKNIPIIVSLGMANRFDPSQVQIIRLDKTTDDPLAKKFRHEVKSFGIDTKSIMAVCSKETPVKDGTNLNSIMTVPSAAGLNIALYVLKHFMKGGKEHEEHL